jgi:toxin CptA
MEILLTGAAFMVSALCAGLMGYAIQRGATCTVAARDEVVRRRGFNRLASMLEASLWVVGGLLIAQALDLLGRMPSGYAITYATVLGGTLLGFGAYVNKACVFGAIARLGSGEWAYAVTPIGFYAGCATFTSIFSFPGPQRFAHGSPVLQAAPWVAVLFAVLMIVRLGWGLSTLPIGAQPGPLPQRVARAVTTRVWSPRAATTVIGITFFVMLLVVGAWAYTDVLAELSRGMAGNLVARTLLLGALLGGAMLGGYTAGRLRSTPVSLAQLAKCFAGGVLMGWGSLLIPGGNDGLILVGIPLLWPYAWLAFFTMCVVIGVALVVEKSIMVGNSAEQAVH